MITCPEDYYYKYIAMYKRPPSTCLAPDQKPKPIIGPLPPIQVSPPIDIVDPPILLPTPVLPFPSPYPHGGYGRRLPPRREPPRRHPFHKRFKPRPVRGPMPPIRFEPKPVPVATGPACPSWGWFTRPEVINGVPSERVIACQPGQATGLSGLFDITSAPQSHWMLDQTEFTKIVITGLAQAATALAAVYVFGKHKN
jgi:hypothetical protein